MLNDLKAEFSQAYVRAVAHAAGYFVQEAGRMFDADGVDLTLMARTPEGTVRSPRLDLQLKATSKPIAGETFAIDLPVKNYDELRSEALQLPRILVVVALPPDPATWVTATQESLLMRHCGYWRSLRGSPETANAEAIRIWLERQNVFHVEQVRLIMGRIQGGGLP